MSLPTITGLGMQSLHETLQNAAGGSERQAMGASASEGKNSFATFLDREVSEVNDLLKTADKKSTEMAIGKSENLHDAMIAVEKAETAFKFMVQLRNKAMEAYNEIIRMQV